MGDLPGTSDAPTDPRGNANHRECEDGTKCHINTICFHEMENLPYQPTRTCFEALLDTGLDFVYNMELTGPTRRVVAL